MTKISVDEDLLRRLIQGAHDSGDLAAAGLAEKLLPNPLPTEVGTVIMWRVTHHGGKDVGTFAERVHVEGEDQWRHNGFDLYSDRALSVELDGKDWWEMVPKKE